jgi:hypothetical protein
VLIVSPPVSTQWRNPGTGDQDASADWLEVYHSVDAISPWTVHRYGNEESADTYASNTVRDDMKFLEKRGIKYIPTVFPGFSVCASDH